ncbi:programmed cell death protein [Anaeramoeba ignava]|uniref:Programmed cell death protein n=1 Tax=Anaeramoeba ignava TaxID=1746090 RepID=A0A9Q0LID5_ANAIG|nr:programmed cell death protein [Anaeramoeba ignava]
MQQSELNKLQQQQQQKQQKQNNAEMQKKQAAMEEQRKAILSQILSTEARERLSRIALVRPEHARQIENFILQSGIRQQISEQQLIDFVEEFTKQTKKETTVKIQRKHWSDDSDEDFY